MEIGQELTAVANNLIVAKKLFKEFGAIWGVRWSSHYSQSQEHAARTAKKWSDMLATLTDEQIKKGLDKCEYCYEWAPSIAEFRNAALNIISADEAWFLVKNNRVEENYLVKEAKKQIKSWDWDNLDEHTLRREFIACYNLILKNT